MRVQGWRLHAAHALGLGLAGLLWVAFTDPFPLAEFCSRNRPTWVFPLFERPRYTALSGHQFLLFMAAAAGLYLAALGVARGLRGTAAALVVLLVVPLGLVAVVAPGYPLLSSDIFKYIFDGRILAVYGDNPFLHVPAEYPEDRFYDLVYWKAVVNAHGPLWRLAEAASAAAGGENCRLAVMAMKVWPIAAYLATTLTIFLVLRSWRPELALWGAMVFAWNPVVVLEAVQNGHNDVVASLPALGAVALAACGRILLAIPLLALAVLVKPLALALAPLLVVSWRRPPPFSHLTTGIALAVAVVAVAYAPFWAGPATLQGLARGNLFSTSPAKALFELLELIGLPYERALAVSSTAATAAFLLLLGLLLLAVARRRVALVPAAAGVFFLYLLVGAQWFNPWYMLWLVPFAALAAAGPPLALGLAFSLLSPLVYAMRDSWPVVAVVFLPIAVLAMRWHAWLGWPPPRPGVRRWSSDPALGSRLPLWRSLRGDQGRP
jgi:alpha-1,6-mannosyltransferase